MINSSYNQIIVTGSIAYDEIMDFPQSFVDYFHPEKLHQINVSFVVNRLEKQLGGIATNISYNLSLLTQKTIKLLGGIGKDGGAFIDFFKKHHIDTEGIIIDHLLYTATGKVITDTNDNQIWGYYYGALESAKKINLKKYANKNSLIIIAANHPSAFLSFQKIAIEQKLNYLYDPGMALTWIKKLSLIEGIKNCRFLVGNDYEIAQILKFAGVKMTDLIRKNISIITTLGEKGVNYKDHNHEFTVPAYKVKKVVDPTGAGDAWRAGFIAGIAENYDTKQALKLGNVLASFAIEKYGTINHKPTKKQIKERFKSL